MPLRPGEILIDDGTPSDVLFPAAFGRGAVPRDYAVQPAEMFAPPSDIPLIPRSEWSDRIKEKERERSNLSDLRGSVPSLDQNGQGFCHDDKTEVLTERGWVPWPDYNWSDLLATVSTETGLMEFQAPFERHVYEYDGELVHSTNRRIDFGVTPDHRMLVRKWDESRRTLSDRYTFQRAGGIGWYAGLMHAPSGAVGTELVEVEVPGDRRYDGDDFLAMLGLIVSDGFAGGSDGASPGKGTRNLVSFASFREETRPVIAALAARLGFREAPSRPGVWNRWGAGALAEWVRTHCYTGGDLKSRNKRVPDIVKLTSARQIKHFLHYFDDRNRDGSQFYSTSKRLTDDLQELHLRIGKRSTITRVAAKEVPYNGKVIRTGESYLLTVGQADQLCLERKKHVEQDRYKGLVYCAAVPNGTLITRRNGTVLISGNCWAYSVAATVIVQRMAAGLPYVRLSAHAVACKIKGFRDEGGWCGLSAQFARETGYPSVAAWPEKSMARQYDTPATWADAAKHKITEDWVDLTRPVYGQNLTFDMVVSLLLSNVPVAADFNFWAHSVCLLDAVEVEPGSFGIRIWNSWADSWGDRGMGVLRGSKAVPDGAVATRTVTPSAA